jgi:hypothetical protein
MNQSKIKNFFFGLITLFFVGCEGEEGPIGPTGLNSLINITNEPAGANCENGGINVEIGVDNNSNGILDTDEILATSYVCNGVDGNTSLTSVTTEPTGGNCENGGIKIDSGIDTNGDGTLDDTEITATAYVCNGVDGNNSLTKITSETAGTNCENGGLKIDSGIDTNSDGTLDDTEITATAYVCNGVDGNNSLTKITSEAAGTNCENGGLKIDTGVDENSDGSLDDTETTATAYACNGLDGNVSLVNVTDESAGANCENGGIKIDSGVDDNGDGTLAITEIDQTSYICDDGSQVVRVEIQVSFEWRTASSIWSQSSTKDEILKDFDIDDYQSFTELYFYTQFDRGQESSDSLGVRLFNYTDSADIDGSETWSLISNSEFNNDPTLRTFKSDNIISSFKSGKIDLGLQIRKQIDMEEYRSISIHSAELVIVKPE